MYVTGLVRKPYELKFFQNVIFLHYINSQKFKKIRRIFVSDFGKNVEIKDFDFEILNGPQHQSKIDIKA